jgi:dienelactone hydrolase
VAGLTETRFDLAGEAGPIPARLYSPAGDARAPGIVLVHGVHRLGIEEPRLVRFARSIAAQGITVLTPEVRELADFQIAPHSIGTIELAVRELAGRQGRRVGLMGMSFAGGLVLMAAADPATADHLGFVTSVGGHDDLGRVLRFFVTNGIDRPDGTHESLHAHDYGPLVLVYAHIDRFFPAADVPAAHEALKRWLWEQFDVAKEEAKRLSPSSKARLDALFDHKIETIAPELMAEIDRSSPGFPSVSPSSVLGRVHVPIYLLHGAGDTVIPATETLWLAHDAPRGYLAQALVSKAISHVELDGEPGLGDRLALVHFMAGMLGEIE